MTYAFPKRLLLELVPVSLIIIIPLSVHAGFFSAFFNTTNAETEAEDPMSQVANAQSVPLLKATRQLETNPAQGGGDIIIEDDALVPSGAVSGEDKIANSKTANGEISVYVVREGDTLSQIAEMFQVSAKTILWANDIANASLIRPGDSLVILPITGVRHVVKSGDTISTIAKKYDGDIDDILSYNQLASASEISVGDTVVIPDGVLVNTTPVKSVSPTKTSGSVAAEGGGSAGFVHPVPGAVRSQGIHGYNGVDLAAPNGTPVLAAASGEVIVAKGSGWNGGYGLYVVVKHPNGTQTLYAHLSTVDVVIGQSVGAGAKIGRVGNTGRSTGSHLHFEVRGARNPF